MNFGSKMIAENCAIKLLELRFYVFEPRSYKLKVMSTARNT
jgi:hypothetical protein